MPSSASFITTATHNYVSRSCTLQDAKRIDIKGRCVINEGSFLTAPLRMQRYVWVGENARLEMPDKYPADIPVVVGGNTYIGSNVISRAAAIGSNCVIADGVTLGNRVMIKDNCVIQSSVSDDTVIPPFTHIGKDGTVTNLAPGVGNELRERSHEQFSSFLAQLS